MALAMARAFSDKKALDVITIDMRKMSSICDYFVIAGGTSTTQVGALADHAQEVFKKSKERLWHVEGRRDALWVVLDYGDVIGHVFLDEMRRFYDLERLWSDAPQKRFKEPAKRGPAKRKPAKRKVVRKKKPKSRKARRA